MPILLTETRLYFMFAVATMNVIGPIQDLSIMGWTQVVNVVYQMRACSMFLRRTLQTFGNLVKLLIVDLTCLMI